MRKVEAQTALFTEARAFLSLTIFGAKFIFGDPP